MSDTGCPSRFFAAAAQNDTKMSVPAFVVDFRTLTAGRDAASLLFREITGEVISPAALPQQSKTGTTFARRGRGGDPRFACRWGAPPARNRTASRRGPGLLLRLR